MFWYVAFALVVAVVASVVASAALRRSRSAPMPRFSARPRLLSEPERAFIESLELALNGRYRVVSKARLVDIIQPHEALSSADHNRLLEEISGIALDCVLCDGHTFEVLAAIQLIRPKRRNRKAAAVDRFIEAALRSANMHLIRIPLQPAYSVAFLATQVESVLSRDFIETLTMPSIPSGFRMVAEPYESDG